MSEPMTYIARKPCGCLAMAAFDSPDMTQRTAREVSKAIRAGLMVDRVPTADVRTMAWRCE